MKGIRESLAVKEATKCPGAWRAPGTHLNAHFVATLTRIHFTDRLSPGREGGRFRAGLHSLLALLDIDVTNCGRCDYEKITPVPFSSPDAHSH